MTIGQYISQKFSAFGEISNAKLLDMCISGGFSIDDEYSEDTAFPVGKAMTLFIEEMVLTPKVKSVNESGFLVSFDFDNLGKYYLWLCRKYGITPNADVMDLLGISLISDKSSCW